MRSGRLATPTKINRISMTGKDLKIAVLMGGIGTEREVSLKSGENIAGSIAAAGLEVVAFDIRPDEMSILDDPSIDVFFPALHGKFGEDGQLQDILEQRGLCYAGSGPEASRTAFDKIVCKEALRNIDISLPADLTVNAADTVGSLKEKIFSIGEKVVVKPIAEGSSFGVQIIEGSEQAAKAAVETYGKFGDCMVEEFIAGREITVGIVNGCALPIIEIRPRTQFYDYDAKYIDDATEYLFETIEDAEVAAKIQEISVECFNMIGCRHWGRVDMILNEENVPYFLELNTLPGFTSHSLIPMAANKAGMSNSELCVRIIEAALESFKKDK